MTPRPSPAPVTGTTGHRICWESSEYSSSFLGYIGTPASPDHWLFQIFKDGDDSEDSELALMSALPGAAGDYRRSASMDELKAEAERWLAGFVSSLGAVFPGSGEALVRIEEEERPAAFFDEHDLAAIKAAADPGTTAATTAREKERPDA